MGCSKGDQERSHEVGRKPRKCDALETKGSEWTMSSHETWLAYVGDPDKSNFEWEGGDLTVADSIKNRRRGIGT